MHEYVAEVSHCRLLQWRGKSLHGEFLKKVEKGGEISESFYWLVLGLLKMPTEVLITAAQDQALAVGAIKHHIYGMSSSYPLHADYVPEYIDHLLSGCLSIAATMYKQRHDSVAKIIHWSLSRQFGLVVPTYYWNHIIGIMFLSLLKRTLI